MRLLPRSITGLAVLILGDGSAFGVNSITGRYDAAINLNGTVIPFRLDISSEETHSPGLFTTATTRRRQPMHPSKTAPSR